MAWITYNPNTGEITGTTIGSREDAEFNMNAGDSIMESATIPRPRVDKIVNGQIQEDAAEVTAVNEENVRYERDQLLPQRIGWRQRIERRRKQK